LLQKRLLVEQDTADLQPQIEATRAVLTRYPRLIEQLEIRLADAEQDAKQLNSSSLEELIAEQCRLEATMPGAVAEVLHQPGDMVKAGDPVVRISNLSTRRIIAFMPEAHRMDLAIGERCRVITDAENRIYHGTVKSITPDIRRLPVNTGFNDLLLRGRRILIEVDDGELLPGEQVVVVPDVSIFAQWFGKK
jgi:Cu(I)/Ag(I) efflux system membrane fusion protein